MINHKINSEPNDLPEGSHAREILGVLGNIEEFALELRQHLSSELGIPPSRIQSADSVGVEQGSPSTRTR